MPKRKNPKGKTPDYKPIPSRLQKLFDGAKAKYTAPTHRIVYTAFDLAATLHIPLADVVKTLLVKTDGEYALVLLSAAHQLDIKKFARMAGVKKVSLPPEKEMVRQFKIKKGPITSFGSLYKVPVYIDRGLTKRKNALFSLGSFRQSVLLSVKDFLNIEKPTVGAFGVKRKMKPSKQQKKKKRNARRKG